MYRNPLRAAAEGLPEINRRRLLLGLAAASTVAATATETVAAATAATENPELLSLGDAFPAIEAEFNAANAELKAAIEKWGPKWPRAPQQLFSRLSATFDSIECDITGRGIPAGKPNKYGEYRYPPFDTTASLEWCLTRAKQVLKGKTVDKRNVSGMNRDEWEAHLDDLVAQYRIAERYEADKARVLKASNYTAVDKRWRAAKDALVKAIAAIMATPETSMAGVIVKAQALAAWEKAGDFDMHFTLGAPQWGPALAAAVLRQAGQKGGVA